MNGRWGGSILKPEPQVPPGAHGQPTGTRVECGSRSPGSSLQGPLSLAARTGEGSSLPHSQANF